MQKYKIGFIINPISGTHNKGDIPSLIQEHLNTEIFCTPDLFFTEHKGHASEFAQKMVDENYDFVVAVGGDGTVNETAKTLLHTNTTLGIIPCGSGNGLARHLGIPMRTVHAIEMLNTVETTIIDYGIVNGKVFFCTCGAGFDADVSWDFERANKRGLNSYIELALKNYLNFKPRHYILHNDQIHIEQDAFLVTFANAAQYGNNIFIAPQASTHDGMMDIAIFSEFPITALPDITLKLLTKQLHKSVYLNYLRTPQITLESSEKTLQFHVDGEAVEMNTPIEISMVHAGLRVLRKKREDKKFIFPIFS